MRAWRPLGAESQPGPGRQAHMELQIPKGKYSRRVFFALVTSVVLLLAIARWILIPLAYEETIPSGHDVLDELLADLLVSVLAGVVVGGALYLLLPPPKTPAQVEVVQAHERGTALEAAREDTRTWWFSGAMGRYTRSVTLPALAHMARDSSITRTAVLQLLDLRDDGLCTAYARYRGAVRTGQGDPDWTLQRVRREICATIVSAYAWRHSERLLQVRVALRSSLSLFRLDLGDSGLVITKEDPREPALSCPSGTFFYNSFLEDLRLSLEQSHELPTAVDGVPLDTLETSSVRGLLTELGLLHEALTDDDLEAIVRLARHPSNPYG